MSEPMIVITVATAERIMHAIDLAMPFWEEHEGLVDAAEMAYIRGVLENAIEQLDNPDAPAAGPGRATEEN